MQRSASLPGTGSGMKLPPLGKSPDISATNLCRAEREFFTIVRRGSWNELGPHCRLSLLRDCAIENMEWPHFTPHCQLWVLREIARVGTEGVGDVGSDGAKALAPLRLKSLVKADVNLSSELSVLCDRCLNLPRVADRLRIELRAHEQSLLRASSGSPRSPHGSSRAGTASTHASSRRGPKIEKPKIVELAVTTKSEPEPSRRRGRGKSDDVQGLGLKGSASAPNLLKKGQGALTQLPGLNKTKLPAGHRGTINADGLLEGLVDDGEAEQEKETVKFTGPHTSATRLAATAWDETRQAFFREPIRETVKIGAKAAEEDEEEAEKAPVMTRKCFNLLPSHSNEGQAANKRELRRQEAGMAVTKALEQMQACSDVCEYPTALLRVSCIKRERMKIRQELEKVFIDYSEIKVVENRELKTDDTTVWDVRTVDDMSVVGAYLRIESEIKGYQYTMNIIWPLERVQAEVGLAFPEYDLSLEDLGLMMPVVVESYRLYADAWLELQSDKKLVKNAELLNNRDSYSRRAGGTLMLSNKGVSLHSIEDPLKQPAQSLEQLMDDAEWAHLFLKETLAPESPWALASMNDLDFLPDGHEDRTWRPEGEGPLKGCWLHDPGLKAPAYVEQMARMKQEPYEIDVPWEDAGIISRVEIVFDNFNQMSSIVDHFLGELQDTGSFEVRWIENNVRRPNCLGLREMSIGVRVSEVNEEDGSTRSHICEVIVSHQYMNYAKHGNAKERIITLQNVLETCGVAYPDLDIVSDILLGALDNTLPASVRQRILICDRLVKYVHAVVVELTDVFKPNDFKVCEDLIKEMAQQATAAGVPSQIVDRMLHRFKVGAIAEEAEWQRVEEERLAKEEAKRAAEERKVRAVQEEEERKLKAEEDARLAEEEAAENEVKEAKRKKAAENEAKKAAKEAAVAGKSADRKADAQAEADRQSKAKSTSDDFLASKGLDSVHAIHESGRTALLMAAAEGDAFLLESVLMQGCDIRGADHHDGAGALHLAAGGGHTENMEVLLRWSLPLEAQTEGGERPMHFAAGSGSIEALECLKTAGAKLNAKSMNGRGPLFSAAAKDKETSAEWLLEHAGASIDQKDDAGTMLMHVAALNNAGNFVTWLLKKGADPTVKDGEGKSAKQIAKAGGKATKKALDALGE